MKRVKIYALVDPNDKQIRYIGKTVARLSTRLTQHLNMSLSGGSKKKLWIKSLLDIGQKPDIVLIEEVDESEWSIREKFWIDLHSDTIYNSSKGGEAGAFIDSYSANAIRYDGAIFTIDNIAKFEREANLPPRSINQVIHGKESKSLKGWRFVQNTNKTIHELLTPNIYFDGIVSREYIIHTPEGSEIKTSNLTKTSKSLGLTLHKMKLGTVRNGYWVERVDKAKDF